MKKHFIHSQMHGKQIIVLLCSYVFFILVAASLSTTMLQAMKSYYVNQWFGKVSSQGFMQMMERENRYFSSAYAHTKKKEPAGALLFSLMTDIRLQDIRTFIGKEIPGMANYYSDILVAGEGTDYTNIPDESSIPVEEITKEREVNKEKIQEAEKNNPVQRKENSIKGKNAVFIYHTHSWESFLPLLPKAKIPDEASSPDVNVSLLGVRLKQQLEGQGIRALHDKTNMGDLLAQKKMKWYQAYKASHGYVKEALTQNKEIAFPIDIHRDDQRKNVTTKLINGKSYARLYFIIGMENEGREENMKIAGAINSYLDKHYYGLSRGIFKKDKNKGDGAYNQDLSSNALLVEVGGVDNTLEELYNSIDVLAEAFSKYYWDAEKVNR
ncbi:stage II sporulation protein P [Bacillus multifaciens]|uniref:stage II sporulation protein P n=1 Tax=Bacillus multifaciens TaxID=3068506 RepID=UPI002740F695|nr:stage II sporulation protein P [Bacillus sp. WLY-B-L8]MDP7977907.1 stage II sporulation protein P [Bacillus sp. WLY-B-L8]